MSTPQHLPQQKGKAPLSGRQTRPDVCPSPYPSTTTRKLLVAVPHCPCPAQQLDETAGRRKRRTLPVICHSSSHQQTPRGTTTSPQDRRATVVRKNVCAESMNACTYALKGGSEMRHSDENKLISILNIPSNSIPLCPHPSSLPP